MAKQPKKPKAPKVARSKSDTADVLSFNEDLVVSIADDGSLVVRALGKRAEIDWQENVPATEDKRSLATVRIRLINAPYVAPDPEDDPVPFDPRAGAPDEEDLAPDA